VCVGLSDPPSHTINNVSIDTLIHPRMRFATKIVLELLLLLL
jgi:hypothetical protein